MRKTIGRKWNYSSLLIALFLLVISMISYKTPVSAATKIVYKGKVIAKKDARGAIYYIPNGKDDHDALEYLLNNSTRKHVVLPKRKTIKISHPISIGSNTVLNATGATIIQMKNEYGFLKNDVKATNYNSAHNITIVGGTWKNRVNSRVYTGVRFAHARNMKFKNMTIITNFQSHCLELIACKDVKVYNCKLIETNLATKTSTSVEDALQIDVATPKTAPGVLAETKNHKFVNGQTCQNIRVESCDVYGARGICTNYARYESQFYGKYHKNITIYRCNIVGTSAQGIALYNTIGAVIKDNTIKTTSRQYGYAYPSGLHVQLFGKRNGGNNVIAYNRIYGMKIGLYINSTYSNVRYTSTKLIGNRIYAKQYGVPVSIKATGALSKSGNRTGRW